MLYLGIAETIPVRLSLISALTRKFNLSSDCDLKRIVTELPNNLTGADFYALCSDAMSRSIERKITLLQIEIDEWNKSPKDGHPHPTSISYYLDHIVEKSKLGLEVTFDDFSEAGKALEPSVSIQELRRYSKIRQQFEPERVNETKQLEGEPIGEGAMRASGTVKRDNGKGKMNP